MEETKQLTGKVYDIQGFSVQDGPGIRTTVFLKGCPLRCPWCHSPESQEFFGQLSWISMRCQGTEICQERCIKACAKGALEYGETRSDAKTGESLQMVHVKRDLCDNCGDCANVCYPQALFISGKDYTVDEMMERLLRDKPFFRDDGGVTISGGECLSQFDFTYELAKRLKENGIGVAIDTTGFAKWENVEKIIPYADLFLYDLKHMNSEIHQKVVGVPNEIILENAKKIAAAGGKFQIRIPIIPMFNNDEVNINETAKFCKELGDSVLTVQLLPYHNLGAMKYLRLYDDITFEATPPSDEEMNNIKAVFESYGLKAIIH